MESVFLQILNMSITATYVFAFIVVMRLLLQRAPKWISYALWSVVLVRLICPVSFSSTSSLFGTAPVTNSSIEYIPHNTGPLPIPQADVGASDWSNIANAAVPVVTPAASADPMQIWILIGTCVWLLGVAAMLIYSVVSYLCLKRRVSNATLMFGNVYETDEIFTPFVCGLVKPKIFLPVGLSEIEREYILRHERTHIMRRDYLIKPFAFLALTIHWFNPFMWLAFVLMSGDMEMSCDERVARELDHDQKADYSAALLRHAIRRPILAGSPLAFGESGTKGRIKNILHYKKPVFWLTAVAVTAAAVVGVCLLANPPQALALPHADVVREIHIEQVNERESIGAVLTSDRLEIEAVLSALSGAKKTLRYSTNDRPDSTNYFAVKLMLSDEERTLYLYSMGSGYYIEEPYVGIYRSSRAGSVAIAKIYAANGGAKGIDYPYIERLLEHRTPYVGDNSEVGAILSLLSFPQDVQYDHFALHTDGEQREVEIVFNTDSDAKARYNQPSGPNHEQFAKNAMLLLALIDNAEDIKYTLKDGASPVVGLNYSREWADAIIEGDVRDYAKNAETLRQLIDFQVFADDPLAMASVAEYTLIKHGTGGEVIAEKSPLTAEARQLAIDTIMNYMYKSAAWEGVDIDTLDECYLIRQTFPQTGETHDYYAYLTDGKPVLQNGAMGWYSVISENLYTELSALFNDSEPAIDSSGYPDG